MTEYIDKRQNAGSRLWKTLVVGIMLTAGFFMQEYMAVYGAEKPENLMSATYCSDAWVVNFWNSESREMEAELAQIKSDGFNSIILVVPWREFQPAISPVSYSSHAWEKLHRVMKAAAEQELWVVLRVGYTWDYYGEGSILGRFEALLYDEDSSREAWLAYTKKLYDEVSGYSHFYGGFLTWEDFWNFTDKAGSIGNGEDSRVLAAKVGYQAYLEKHYTLEVVCQIYQTEFDSYRDIYLPKREEFAYLLFYEFYDNFLNQLLEETQYVFPDLSMEVRLDVDPVTSEDGKSEIGIPHYSTFSCKDSSFSSAMYGVSMGNGFEAELTAAEAVETLKQQLVVMRNYNSQKPIYLDQFLYMDTTEEFAHNAQLNELERPKFLTMSAPVLRSMTMGYGIWSYRNYTDNAVYNAQFALGSDGWICTGGVVIEEKDGSMAAGIPSEKASLSQNLAGRLSSRKNPISVSFTAQSEEPAVVTVSIGNISKTVSVNGSKQVVLNFGDIAGESIRFKASDNVWIDNVNVYSYEQDGQLYGLGGEELSCLEAMRELNALMK